ncbi:cell division protein FtsQ/DivIB [Aquisalibacillus elongatus]|uniref:Cell division protein DivIB n=1 Tax=Aquisalibacillus elongatus TaxID=485577 RepID=A0A3N5BF35_9BACI|nr:FtsQ-type POTRA domain-containing protein [Aquisalibacillus elongatus]RPF56077.1 cell division protein FtsQ [Aquisalibacillus elongatus]
MAEKKVVSIEDRIPQLKQLRKKKANRRFVTYLILILLLILVIVYLQSPLSHIQSIKVEQNRVVSSDEITRLSELKTDQSFWGFDPGATEQKIEKHLEVNDVSISREWYNQVVIEVNEFNRVGYVKSDELFHPILENGNVLEEIELKVPRADAPILYDFSDSDLLPQLTQKLSQLDPSIVQLISEIHWDPDDSNQYQVKMFTTDGQEVIASIHNFIEKMEVYPSIASQLTADMEGVLYIDVGAYFKPYGTGEEDVELESADSEQEDTAS